MCSNQPEAFLDFSRLAFCYYGITTAHMRYGQTTLKFFYIYFSMGSCMCKNYLLSGNNSLKTCHLYLWKITLTR